MKNEILFNLRSEETKEIYFLLKQTQQKSDTLTNLQEELSKKYE